MDANVCQMCSRWDDDADLQIAELEHTRLILNRDQFFPGYCLLFTKLHATELFHLEPAVLNGLIAEVSHVAACLDHLFKPAKMNYELLGNMVPHIHWHLIPRFVDDPLWPRPVWSEPHDELRLDPASCRQRCSDIRTAVLTGAR